MCAKSSKEASVDLVLCSRSVTVKRRAVAEMEGGDVVIVGVDAVHACLAGELNAKPSTSSR